MPERPIWYDPLPLDAVRARIAELSARIGAPENYGPTYGRSEDFARPHIEVDRAYHYVVVERGLELERRSTDDLDALLYWALHDITWQMASDWELANRREGEDSRRQLFARHVELLERLSPSWAARTRDGYETTLRLYPYRDP